MKFDLMKSLSFDEMISDDKNNVNRSKRVEICSVVESSYSGSEDRLQNCYGVNL